MFTRHVGKQGDRKVAVVFREVPGEPHMCLVVHTELLNQHIHDPLIQCIESDIGQNSEHLADALNRNLLPDGRTILGALHAERMMKRVNTEQVLMTPTMNSNVKLSELNKILNEMKQGEDAVRKMAEIDGARGLVDPKQKRAAEADFKKQYSAPAESGYTAAPMDGALDDRAIAANMLTQAVRMHNEATGIINEAARMRKEAERLYPGVKMMDLPPMAPLPVVETTQPVAKTRGRKPKLAAAHAAQ
jgi:hypothetical protein